MEDSAGVAAVEVFAGVDVAKKDHWACAVTAGGEELFSRAVRNDEAAIDALIDYARRNADRLGWAESSEGLLARLRILNGRDADLAADANRAANRLRDALLAVCPALERTVGDQLATSAGLRQALSRWPTPTASTTQPASPPTPGSPPPTPNQAAATPPDETGAATTGSKTPCSKPPSPPPNTTPAPAPTT